MSHVQIVVYRADFRPATVGEARSLPRSTSFQLPTRIGEFVPVYHICTIQPNTQLTNLAGGYEPPLQWRVRFLPAKQQFLCVTDWQDSWQ